MSQIIHEAIVNVESGLVSSIKPPIDIHQGDSGSHTLLFKLQNNEGKSVSISESGKINIKFVNADNKVVSSNAVNVVNAYRGVLTYTLGPAIVADPGRYTVYLDMNYCGCSCNNCCSSISFTVNISKNHSYSSDVQEVTISSDFYEDLQDHLSNADIHLSSADRSFLDKYELQTDALDYLLSVDLDDLVSETVESEAKQILASAFITVDNLSDLEELSHHRDQLVQGKIVRVNYGDPDSLSDNTPHVVDNHEDTSVLFTPKYFVCNLIGDDETVVWTPLDFGGGHDERVDSLISQLFEVEQRLNSLSNQVADQGTTIESLQSSNTEIVNQISNYEDRISYLENKIIELDQGFVYEEEEGD